MQIQELINLVSNAENKLLQNYSKKKNQYDIAPVDSDGSPSEDATARPTIVFDVLDDELAVRWIYLNVRNQGLGTRIIQWLIDYCKSNSLGRISIRMVGQDNSSMMALAKKFSFSVIVSRGNGLNYELVIEE